MNRNIGRLKLPLGFTEIKRFFKSKTFIRNFLVLAAILLGVFLIFSVVIFSMFKNALNQEFVISSQSKLEEFSHAVDSHINDVRFTISFLENNNIVRAFFFHHDPESIYDDFNSQLRSLVNASIQSSPYIDSIYLYAHESDTIFSEGPLFSGGTFSDYGWISQIEKENSDLQVFFRKKHNIYPFILTIAKSIRSGDAYATIVVNINLREMSILSNLNSNSQSIYLVSDTGQILYSARQSNIEKQAQTIPELISYSPRNDTSTTLVSNSNVPYTYAQSSSQLFPWNYVLITYLPEYNTLLAESSTLILIMAFALVLAGFALAFILSMRSIKPIRDLTTLLENPENALSSELYNNQEIQEISDHIFHYVRTNQALTAELSSKLALLTQTKLLALQAQINPHFLFNTLNMIYIQETEALGYSHPVPKLTIKLSRLLRYAIESTDMVPLSTELEFAKDYIVLLQERYNQKPHVVYDISESSLQARIPKLTIQPIIENAIFHGLSKQMSESSTLTLSCHNKDGFCILTVQDNGVGMTPEVLHNLTESLNESVPLQNSIGLKNIVTRMQLVYGEAFSIRIESKPCFGSKFILTFPLLDSPNQIKQVPFTQQKENPNHEITV